MALSTGQITSAFQSALGRSPTGTELQKYSADNSFEGSPGQSSLISQLQGGGGGGGNNNSSYDPTATIQKAIQMQQQASAPAIQSLQSSIPEIQQKYAQTRSQLQAQQPTLQEQYKNLLDQVNTQKTQSLNNQTKITANELGQRGIVGDSTLAKQELQNATEPINQQYTNLYNQTGVQQTQAMQDLQNQIANLTPQETSDERAIQNAIGQLQSGAASQGAQLGANLYSSQIQNQLAQSQLDQQAKQNAIANALAQMQYQNIQLPQSRAQIANIGSEGGVRASQIALNNAQVNSLNNQAKQYDPTYLQQLFGALGLGGNSNATPSLNSFVKH